MDQHRIRATTLGDLLLSAADRVPDRDLLIFPERRVTYRQMVQAAYRRAAALQRLGVGQGDHVGILMPNCIEYIEVLFGAVLLGAIAVPMNARYKPSELAYVVENADLKVIVTNDLISEYANFAQLLADALPGLAGSDTPEALAVQEAPLLRAVVLMGASTAPGFVSNARFDELAGESFVTMTLRSAFSTT